MLNKIKLRLLISLVGLSFCATPTVCYCTEISNPQPGEETEQEAQGEGEKVAEERQELIDETSEYMGYYSDGTEEDYIYEDNSVLSDEYKQTMEAQPQESLTPEQEEEGWILYDGYALPPNDLTGEAGEFIRGESDVNPKYCGYVTFVANCPEGFSSEAYILIMDTATFNEYAYTLSPSNDYRETVRVPVGQFIIMEGGPLDDFQDRYAISQSYFTVEKGETKKVSVAIVDREEQFNKYEKTPDESSDSNGLTLPEQEEEVKKNILAKIIILVILVASLIGIGFLIKRTIEKIRSQ